MKVRALVAKMDGVPGADGTAFAPGSLKPCTVPVTQDFDPRRPPIGTATLVVEGTDVYAEIEVADPQVLVTKYPAVSVLAQTVVPHRVWAHGFDVITAGTVGEVSICTSENADPRIPPFS